MATRVRNARRGLGHDSAGTVDDPWDDDRRGSHELIESDATCWCVWREDGFEGVSVFVDPALRDRADDICRTVQGILGDHRDIDTLSEALETYAEQGRMSASVYERPPEALTENLVAVTFTLG